MFAGDFICAAGRRPDFDKPEAKLRIEGNELDLRPYGQKR